MPRVIGALLALVLAFLPAPADSRRLRCEGAFARSCVRKLYRCFDASGACTRDLSRYFGAGIVTDCWENGARATLTGFGATSGTSEFVTSKGRTCRMGTTAFTGGGIVPTVEITYVRRRKIWVIQRTPAGDFTVTCPNGRVEEYAAADVVATGCGPIAECPAGSCP